MTSPFTSSFTFTLNVTDTVVPVGTAIRFHVNTSPVNVPPLSAEPSTYVVYAGSLSVTTTSWLVPVVFVYVILYVSSCPATTALPSILVVSVPVNTSFFGWVGVGLVVVLVFTLLNPSCTSALFSMTCPFASALTFTLKWNSTVLPTATSSTFHDTVFVAASYTPPLSAVPVTYSVYSGITSFTSTVRLASVVFVYLIVYVISSPFFTGLPSIEVVMSAGLNTSFFGWVGVGFFVVLVSKLLIPSFVCPLFSMTSACVSSSTFTWKLTVTLLPCSTPLTFQVIVPLFSTPFVSALTNVVCAGSVSVISTSLVSPVVFVYVIWYVRISPAFTLRPSMDVVVSPCLNTSFFGWVGVYTVTGLDSTVYTLSKLSLNVLSYFVPALVTLPMIFGAGISAVVVVSALILASRDDFAVNFIWRELESYSTS